MQVLDLIDNNFTPSVTIIMASILKNSYINTVVQNNTAMQILLLRDSVIMISLEK